MLTAHEEDAPEERKDFLQQELDCQVEDFLANGGVVQKIQSGVSGVDSPKISTLDMANGYYRLGEIANELNLTPSKVYKDAERGKLDFETIRGAKRVSKTDFKKYAAKIKQERDL